MKVKFFLALVSLVSIPTYSFADDCELMSALNAQDGEYCCKSNGVTTKDCFVFTSTSCRQSNGSAGQVNQCRLPQSPQSCSGPASQISQQVNGLNKILDLGSVDHQPAPLIIIDMQNYFVKKFPSSVADNLVAQINYRITEAKKNHQPIFVVGLNSYEFSKRDPPDSKETDKRILDQLNGYKYVFRVKKADRDSSAEIITELEKQGIQPKELEICGVNTNVCVFETVRGLRDHLSCLNSVHIHPEACNSDQVLGHKKGLSQLSHIPGVHVYGDQGYFSGMPRFEFKKNGIIFRRLDKQEADAKLHHSVDSNLLSFLWKQEDPSTKTSVERYWVEPPKVNQVENQGKSAEQCLNLNSPQTKKTVSEQARERDRDGILGKLRATFLETPSEDAKDALLERYEDLRKGYPISGCYLPHLESFIESDFVNLGRDEEGTAYIPYFFSHLFSSGGSYLPNLPNLFLVSSSITIKLKDTTFYETFNIRFNPFTGTFALDYGFDPQKSRCYCEFPKTP